jgi:hypothetical protein
MAGASADRQAELALNRDAIALDRRHRTTDPKRTPDEPPPALQHAHAREADVLRERSKTEFDRRGIAVSPPIPTRSPGGKPPAPKALRDVGQGRGRSRDDPMIRIAGVERRERSEGREAEDCWPPAGGFRGGGYLGSPPLSSSGHALGSRLLITGMR